MFYMEKMGYCLEILSLYFELQQNVKTRYTHGYKDEQSLGVYFCRWSYCLSYTLQFFLWPVLVFAICSCLCCKKYICYNGYFIFALIIYSSLVYCIVLDIIATTTRYVLHFKFCAKIIPLVCLHMSKIFRPSCDPLLRTHIIDIWI